MVTFRVIGDYDFELPVKRPLYQPGDRHVYIDFCNHEPFYVGMGTWERVNDVRRNDTHAQLWGNLGPNDVIVRRVVARGYSRVDAELLETRLILKYGRRDVETGPLVNKNNGVGNERQYEAREQVQRQRRAEEQKRRAEQEQREAVERAARQQAERERVEKAKRVEVLFDKFKDEWASIPPALRTDWLNQIAANAPAWKETLSDVEKRLNADLLEQEHKAQAEAARQARERDEAEARRETQIQAKAAENATIVKRQKAAFQELMFSRVFGGSLIAAYFFSGCFLGLKGIGLMMILPFSGIATGMHYAFSKFIAEKLTEWNFQPSQEQPKKAWSAGYYIVAVLLASTIGLSCFSINANRERDPKDAIDRQQEQVNEQAEKAVLGTLSDKQVMTLLGRPNWSPSQTQQPLPTPERISRPAPPRAALVALSTPTPSPVPRKHEYLRRMLHNYGVDDSRYTDAQLGALTRTQISALIDAGLNAQIAGLRPYRAPLLKRESN